MQQVDLKWPCKNLMQGKRNWETAGSLFSGNIAWNSGVRRNFSWGGFFQWRRV